MSQKVKIMGVKHSGASVKINGEYTRDPNVIMQHNADIFRARFNDCRAHRSTRRYDFFMDDYGNEVRKNRASYVEDVPASNASLWDNKNKALITGYTYNNQDVPLGGTTVEINKLSSDTEFYVQNPWVDKKTIFSSIINKAPREEKTEWGAALKRIKTTGRGKTPEFKSKKSGYSYFTVKECATYLHRCGKKTWVVHIKGGGRLTKDKFVVKVRVRSSQPIRSYSKVTVNLTTGYVVFTNIPLPLTGVKHTGAQVGIDRGVAHTLTTSDGEFIDMPKKPSENNKIKKLQKDLSRKKGNDKGEKKSNRYLKTLNKINVLKKKQARRRETFHHQNTAWLVKNYDLVVLEELNISGMMKSAKGTIESPGKNVAAKRGLNRAISEQNWYQFQEFLAYKAEIAGTHVEFVPAQNTSRQCSECGHIAKENRESQAIFKCVKCDHSMNADVNAAINILNKFLKNNGAGQALERGDCGATSSESVSETLTKGGLPPTAHTSRC